MGGIERSPFYGPLGESTRMGFRCCGNNFHLVCNPRPKERKKSLNWPSDAYSRITKQTYKVTVVYCIANFICGFVFVCFLRPESGLTELASLGQEAKWLIIPITLATIFLLGILILSYIMGILAYPNGGGAYAIAKDNFKPIWISLVASSSLLIDYILTVAVSISAAMEALVSAYHILAPYETVLAILCVTLLVIINLRGVAESARVLAWPTIGFMIMYDSSYHGRFY